MAQPPGPARPKHSTLTQRTERHPHAPAHRARPQPGLHHSPHHHAPPRRDRGEKAPFPLGPFAALVVFCVTVPYLFGFTFRMPLKPPERRLSLQLPNPSTAGHTVEDLDGDGLRDALEDELLHRFSPTALLRNDERSWPASIAWMRERIDMALDGPITMGVVVPHKRFDPETSQGSRDPKDWTMYGHAYPRKGGGIVLQYWLYFAFNDAPISFFNHEGDWEHVSVELDANHEPEFFVLARHTNNAPGVRFPWSVVPKEHGTHPIYYVARGSHAAYLNKAEAPFWERITECPRASDGTLILDGCPVQAWRAGAVPGRPSPLVNVGERTAPRSDGDPDGFFMMYQGLWGDAAITRFASAAPPGPPYQAGFCANAEPGTCP